MCGAAPARSCRVRGIAAGSAPTLLLALAWARALIETSCARPACPYVLFVPDRHLIGKARGPFLPWLKPTGFLALLCKTADPAFGHPLWTKSVRLIRRP